VGGQRQYIPQTKFEPKLRGPSAKVGGAKQYLNFHSPSRAWDATRMDDEKLLSYLGHSIRCLPPANERIHRPAGVYPGGGSAPTCAYATGTTGVSRRAPPLLREIEPSHQVKE